jgi:transcriptional regulator with XRE-family HTH domain
MTPLALQRGGQMDQDQGVGREVKRLREAKGWSQTKLAVEAGMSVSGISMIENGHRNLSTTTLAKLAEALGVGVRDLFPLDQAPLPNLDHERGFNAWVVTLQHYDSMRDRIANFSELERRERRRVLDEALELFQELRQFYDRTNREVVLLHDAVYQSVLRMVEAFEREQERGNVGADVVDIEEYRARLERSA